MYPAINDTHIFGLPIPKIDTTIEAQVVGNIHDAKAAKMRTAQLLESAKRTVEIAIENGEAAAMAYLNQNQGAS